MVAIAQGDVQLITTDEVIRLSPQLKVFRETDNPLGLFDVKQKLDEFVWQPDDNPNYGFWDKGVWLWARRPQHRNVGWHSQRSSEGTHGRETYALHQVGH